MPPLKGSGTEENLRRAFAREAMANRRYHYFAEKAENAGQVEAATLFRSTAEGETGHATGHLEFLEEAGDPASGLPMGDTAAQLRAAIASESADADIYRDMAATAREEGFDEIADWFETLAKAEQSHAARFEKALAALK